MKASETYTVVLGDRQEQRLVHGNQCREINLTVRGFPALHLVDWSFYPAMVEALGLYPVLLRLHEHVPDGAWIVTVTPAIGDSRRWYFQLSDEHREELRRLCNFSPGLALPADSTGSDPIKSADSRDEKTGGKCDGSIKTPGNGKLAGERVVAFFRSNPQPECKLLREIMDATRLKNEAYARRILKRLVDNRKLRHEAGQGLWSLAK